MNRKFSSNYRTPYQQLSASLTAAIETGNDVAVSAVLLNANAAKGGGALSPDLYDELVTEAREAGYDFA